jgi:hypothetical protein
VQELGVCAASSGFELSSCSEQVLGDAAGGNSMSRWAVCLERTGAR